jgi:hypothetical protein
MSATVAERTATDDIALAADETLIGYAPDGRPLVRTKSGKAGLTFGVTYICDPVAYDDAEAFDPLGLGAW